MGWGLALFMKTPGKEKTGMDHRRCYKKDSIRENRFPRLNLVTLPGLEPGTYCLEGNCSIRLSYRAGFGVHVKNTMSAVAFTLFSRGGWIRTSDLHVPNVAR